MSSFYLNGQKTLFGQYQKVYFIVAKRSILDDIVFLLEKFLHYICP